MFLGNIVKEKEISLLFLLRFQMFIVLYVLTFFGALKIVRGDFKALSNLQTTYMKQLLLNTHFPDEETKVKREIKHFAQDHLIQLKSEG